MKDLGGKSSTRSTKFEPPTLSRANNVNSVIPLGPQDPPMEPPIGGWPEERSMEGRARRAAQPRSLSYAATLRQETEKNGAAKMAPKVKLTQVAGGGNAGWVVKSQRKAADKTDESVSAGEREEVTPQTTEMTGFERGGTAGNVATAAPVGE